MPEIEIQDETEMTRNGEKKVVQFKLDAMTRYGNWAGTASQLSYALGEMADSKRESAEELIEKGFEEDSAEVERCRLEADRFEEMSEKLDEEVDSQLNR